MIYARNTRQPPGGKRLVLSRAANGNGHTRCGIETIVAANERDFGIMDGGEAAALGKPELREAGDGASDGGVHQVQAGLSLGVLAVKIAKYLHGFHAQLYAVIVLGVAAGLIIDVSSVSMVSRITPSSEIIRQFLR